MKRRIQSLLRKAGLKEEEIQLYLVLLQNKSTTLRELQAKTGFTHISIYRTVHRLLDRALIQSIPINKKQAIYMPLSLKGLIGKIEKENRRLKKLELSLRDVDHLLPFMGAECTNDNEPEDLIEIHEGSEAFCDQYLKLPELQSEEFLAIGSSDDFWQASGANIDSPLERSFVSRRLKNNVYSRTMMVASDDSERIAKNDEREKRTTKLKKSLPVMSSMLMICGDQASHFLCDPENPRVIVMKDPALVQMQKKGFESMWKA